MSFSISPLVAWLKSKNITSHVIAGLITTLSTGFAFDPTFRGAVGMLFVNYPRTLASLGAVLTIWLKYSHSSSEVGTVARAQNILQSPNPPTQTEVDAANVQGPPITQVTK
jgi:hypothetical protein